MRISPFAIAIASDASPQWNDHAAYDFVFHPLIYPTQHENNIFWLFQTKRRSSTVCFKATETFSAK